MIGIWYHGCRFNNDHNMKSERFDSVSKGQVDAREKAFAGAFRGELKVPEPEGMFKLYMLVFLSSLPLFFYALFLILACGFFLKTATRFLFVVIEASAPFYTFAYCVALVLIGGVLALFCRPLFTVRRDLDDVKLDRDVEPGLYALANTLSARLGVEQVADIYVTTDVVVDASYGSVRAFKERSLSLRLGLPLLVTLKANEIAALIAHELTHYSHPKIRVVYYLLRNIRQWLYLNVHRRDLFLERLETLSENYRALAAITLPIRLGIYFVDKLFAGFLALVENISQQATYEIEFIADEVQAQIIGSRNFDLSLKRLVQVDQAYHYAFEKMLSQESLPANMSDLIHALYVKSPVPSNQFIEMAVSEQFNGWHLLPTPSSRTRRIASLNYEPLFHLDKPIEDLCTDLDAMGISLTKAFYQTHDIQSDATSASAILDERNRPLPLPAEMAILKKYSSGLFRRDVVWLLPQDDKLKSLPEDRIIPFLNKVVVSVRHSLPEFNACIGLLDDYNKHLAQFHFYQWLIKDGSKNRPDADAIENAQYVIKEFETKHGRTIESYCKSYGVRVAAAVELGRESKAYRSAKTLMAMLLRLSALQSQVRDAKIKCNTLEKLLARRAEGDVFHQKTISRLTRMVLKTVENIETGIGNFSPSLLAQETPINVLQTRLRLEELNGEDYERMVADRFHELVRYYEAFNTGISAKLAQFVGMVERKKGIETVAKVSIDDH